MSFLHLDGATKQNASLPLLLCGSHKGSPTITSMNHLSYEPVVWFHPLSMWCNRGKDVQSGRDMSASEVQNSEPEWIFNSRG